jgi:hypothetical protein
MFASQVLKQRFIFAGGVALMTLGAAAAAVPAAHADVHPPVGPVSGVVSVGGIAAAPAMNIRSVSPGGTEVRAEVTSTELTTFSYRVTLVPTTTPPVGGVVAAFPNGGVLSVDGAPPPAVYDTKHNLYKTGLKPNTTYDLNVSGVTQNGVQVSDHARFTTFRQRLRVTLNKIDISDDGDTFGSGEPTWFWQVGWSTGTVNDCYPQDDGKCKVGNATEGTVYPYTNAGSTFQMIFADENFQPIVDPNPQPGREDFTTMPQQLVLDASAKEDDSILGGLDAFFDWGAWLSGNPEATWTVPQGVEHASKSLTVAAEDGNFRSTMTFTFEVFYDNQVYTPNDGRVFLTSR